MRVPLPWPRLQPRLHPRAPQPLLPPPHPLPPHPQRGLSSDCPATPHRPPNGAPAARKMIADQGVNAADAGTGRGGRITKGDVLTAVSAPKRSPAASAPRAGASRRWRRARIRSAIARSVVATPRKKARPDVAAATARLPSASYSRNPPLRSDHVQRGQHAGGIELRNRYKDKFEKEYGVSSGSWAFRQGGRARAEEFPVSTRSMAPTSCTTAISTSASRGEPARAPCRSSATPTSWWPRSRRNR